jgi:hypothetical protein
MKKITVYADFNFLTAPEEIGTLGYEHVLYVGMNYKLNGKVFGNPLQV